IPHGVAVSIDKMCERKNKPLIDIIATIYCEKENHKRIIIGKNGSMLKKIGSQARHDIELFLDSKVNLNIWVKVKNRISLLKNFGYDSNNLK
ncbi:MAG: KH domain-containing protein, partial [Spirochaetales bacterium]|nr:KH domain-containing protein [Spirochaetales bacterium]